MNQNSEIGDRENEEQQVVEENFTDVVKRKKKKRRKKLESSKDQQIVNSKEIKDGDEIEIIVKEVNKLLGEPLPGCSSQDINNSQWIEQKSKKDILLVQHKHLNPYNELKRIFGSKTVQDEQKYV